MGRTLSRAGVGWALALVLLVGVASAWLVRPDGSTVGGSEDRPRSGRPDIVLVVMDDFSKDLLPSMGQAAWLERHGARFVNSFAIDSQCCPSRAAILSGLPPHLNGVRTNTSAGPGGPLGGFPAFARHGNVERMMGVTLQDGGYNTGFVGKFMNEYEPGSPDVSPEPMPGWTDFEMLTGGAYNGWGFARTHIVGDRLELRRHPVPDASEPDSVKDRSYATNVVADRAVALAESYQQDEDPYFLYVAPYGPHQRMTARWPGEPLFPPAFRDRPGGPAGAWGDCGPTPCSSLTAWRLPGFGDDPRDNRPTVVTRARGVRTAASWRVSRGRLSVATINQHLRSRARMVQSIDRMIERLREAIGPDAYLILTSDNGFHLGQYGLRGGKGTPYDSDVRVPLLVSGPGVEPGPRTTFTTNLDLASTIEDLAGVDQSVPRAGSSLVPSLRDRDAAPASYAFTEHTHGPVRPGEPDADAGTGGRLDAIPSYLAIRSARGLLVRLDLDHDRRRERFAWELYDYGKRSWEARNVYAEQRHEPWARELRRRLEAWDGCHPAECRRLTLA